MLHAALDQDAATAVAEAQIAPVGQPEVAGPPQPAPTPVDDEDLGAMLLAALVAMAVKSKRRQADVSAALRRSGIVADRERISAALRRLEAASLVRDPVPLYDGGTLVTVTNMGMDLMGRSADWRFLQNLNVPH